jgi:hypothetical protein
VLRSDDAILADAVTLHAMWRRGALGGEVMPEDAHPPLDPASEALARYFTLGMTLNYQRSSYVLWKACTAAFDDPETGWVFDPAAVAASAETDLREALLKHRVALQPTRHPDTSGGETPRAWCATPADRCARFSKPVDGIWPL